MLGAAFFLGLSRLAVAFFLFRLFRCSRFFSGLSNLDFAGLAQGNRDGLFAALHLAAAVRFQFAVLELVHDTANHFLCALVSCCAIIVLLTAEMRNNAQNRRMIHGKLRSNGEPIADQVRRGVLQRRTIQRCVLPH